MATQLSTEDQAVEYEKLSRQYKAGEISWKDYMRGLRGLTPPQTSDSTDLIREDREDPRR